MLADGISTVPAVAAGPIVLMVADEPGWFLLKRNCWTVPSATGVRTMLPAGAVCANTCGVGLLWLGLNTSINRRARIVSAIPPGVAVRVTERARAFVLSMAVFTEIQYEPGGASGLIDTVACARSKLADKSET